MGAPHRPDDAPAIVRAPGHWGPAVVLSWLRQNVLEMGRRHVSAVLRRREWRPVTIRPGLAKARIVLALCIKDERARLDYHLDYYRRLGVEHFVIVDNESTDGTLAYLEDHGDVSTISAVGSFLEARFGTDWINGVLHRYCRGKWVLWLDADELLVFAKTEGASLSDLVRQLDLEGRPSLQTIMLDMYSERPPSRNFLRPGQDPLEVCGLFDRSGYRQKFGNDNRVSWIKGGVRSRLFFVDAADGPALNKTPLVRWRRHHVFMKVGHQLWPGRLNGTTRLGGALLHFKFTDVAAGKIASEAYRAQHTEEYDAYDDLDAVSFVGDPTTRYEDARQLERLGLIRPFL